MASGTRADVRTPEERRRDQVLSIRRGDRSWCPHDDMNPEDLPPPPQGTFEEHYEAGRTYYPTIEEQWPRVIPEGLAPCNLEQYKERQVYPGNKFPIPPTQCGYCMLDHVIYLQLVLAVERWTNSHTDEEFLAIPAEAIGPYRA